MLQVVGLRVLDFVNLPFVEVLLVPLIRKVVLIRVFPSETL